MLYVCCVLLRSTCVVLCCVLLCCCDLLGLGGSRCGLCVVVRVLCCISSCNCIVNWLWIAALQNGKHCSTGLFLQFGGSFQTYQSTNQPTICIHLLILAKIKDVGNHQPNNIAIWKKWPPARHAVLEMFLRLRSSQTQGHQRQTHRFNRLQPAMATAFEGSWHFKVHHTRSQEAGVVPSFFSAVCIARFSGDHAQLLGLWFNSLCQIFHCLAVFYFDNGLGYLWNSWNTTGAMRLLFRTGTSLTPPQRSRAALYTFAIASLRKPKRTRQPILTTLKIC